MTLVENIATRKLASEVFELAGDQAAGLPGPQKVRFWKHLIRLASQFVELSGTEPSDTKREIMSDRESRIFGDARIQFGMHRGTRVDEIPLEYLEWLDDQPDFRCELRRYLNSERLKREMEAGVD